MTESAFRQNMVCISLQFHRWRGNYRIHAAQILVHDDPLDQERASRPVWRLLPRRWQTRFNMVEGLMRRRLLDVSVGFPVPGVRAIPAAIAGDILRDIETVRSSQYEPLVSEFCESWSAIRGSLLDSVTSRQRTVIDQLLPASSEPVRKKFGVEVHLFPMTGWNGTSLSGEAAVHLAEEIQTAARRLIQAASQRLADELCETLHEASQRLRARLDSAQLNASSVRAFMHALEKVRLFQSLMRSETIARLEAMREELNNLDMQEARHPEAFASITTALRETMDDALTQLEQDLQPSDALLRFRRSVVLEG